MIPTVDGIPVLLPAHEHPEFGDVRKHYHIDFRYLLEPARQDKVVFSDSPVVRMPLIQVKGACAAPIGNPDICLFLSQKYTKAVDGKCPHKGLPIVNGVCLGHNLCFDDAGWVKQDWSFEIPGFIGTIRWTIQVDRFRVVAEATEECWIEEILTLNTGKVVARSTTHIHLLPGDTAKIRFGAP